MSQEKEFNPYVVEPYDDFEYEMCLENFREAKKEGLWELTDEEEYFSHADECDFYAAGYCKMPENMGEFSDGYHTFNELYHHRAVLFSVICNMFPEKAWKSKKHDTGDMYEGMFIVGIETEQGQATYHYDIEPYWDMFKVKELDKAPKYDGHTPSDAIERIGNLPCEDYHKQSEWISVEERLPVPYADVIVYDKASGVIMDSMLSTGEFVNGLVVTHWMPLPEPPKKGGGE